MPPVNDNFASATTLSPSGGTLIGSNEGATLEPGEQPIYDGVGGASVWFKMTPTQSGMLIVNTDDSDFDTILGVWTGSVLGSLTLIADDDESGTTSVPGTPGYFTSAISVGVSAGVTYWIEVDGYEPSNPEAPYGRGTIHLAWSLALYAGADDIADASLLSARAGTVVGTTQGATTEPGEWGPDTEPDAVRAHTIWFKFDPKVRGRVTLFVKRPLEDSVVYYAVYRHINYPAPVNVAELQEVYSSSDSDAFSESWDAQVLYNPEYGPLWIQCGQDEESLGEFTLRWELEEISDSMNWIAS